jgi:integrase
MLHDSGGNIHAVQQRLGHADPSTTLRMYGHALVGSQKAVAEKTLVSFLGDASGPEPGSTDHIGKQRT